MIIAVWAVFVLLLLVWTGAIGLSVQLVEWVLVGLASGQVSEAVTAAGDRTAPGWLQALLDPAALQTLQDALRTGLRWLGESLPFVGGLTGWVTALMWIVWFCGAVFLVVVAGVVHWLLRKFRSVDPTGQST